MPFRKMALVLSNSMCETSESILQVITVKIIGDFTGHDYFADGLSGPMAKPFI